jgi:hypothetical protein
VQKLNAEFGSTAGTESGLSVKVKIPRGQIGLVEFDQLWCNGLLTCAIQVCGRQHEMWPEESYVMQGTFAVEKYGNNQGEHNFTLRAHRHTFLPTDASTDDAYRIWGMFGALAGKSGTIEVTRMGDIPVRPVGRPPKEETSSEQEAAA